MFIVKTHRQDDSLITHDDCVKIGSKRLNFSCAIYIIRNPYNAFLAEFNRQSKQKGKLGNRTSNNKMGMKLLMLSNDNGNHNDTDIRDDHEDDDDEAED